MDTQKPEPGKPRRKNRKKVLFAFILLFACYAILQDAGHLISDFFDIASFFPFKTYTGENFSLTYPQNWKVSGRGDDISISPQLTWLSFPEPDEYDFNDIHLVTQPATSSPPSEAATNELLVWKQHSSYYQSATMPQTATMGGIVWRQLAAIYDIDSKNDSSIPIEEVALSTVHRTKDSSCLSFLMVFSTNPTIFDRMYQQVVQRIFRSFTFR